MIFKEEDEIFKNMSHIEFRREIPAWPDGRKATQVIMHLTASPQSLTSDQLSSFERDGYLILRAFFSAQEVSELRALFDAIAAGGTIPGFFEPATIEQAQGDVLKIFPRVINPHRFNAVARRYLLLPRLQPMLEELMGEAAVAAQSMMYFKPPGARGQSMHQDNLYLQVKPGTCLAFWVAVDDVDQENGGLSVVPKTHLMDVQCPGVSDPGLSFAREEVKIPEGHQPVPANLKAGDVLFFGGSVIHGSPPNTSKARFRRSFICHYFPASTAAISAWFKPTYRFNGEEFSLADNKDGGPCGTEWSTAYH